MQFNELTTKETNAIQRINFTKGTYPWLTLHEPLIFQKKVSKIMLDNIIFFLIQKIDKDEVDQRRIITCSVLITNRSHKQAPINLDVKDVGNFGPYMRMFHGARFFQQMWSLVREAGSPSPSIFFSNRQISIVDFRREVRWRSPLQSNVSKLVKSLISRPSLWKGLEV